MAIGGIDQRIMNGFTRTKEQELWSDPNFQERLKSQTGTTNPFDINSSNSAERTKAEQWYRSQEKLLGDGRADRPIWESLGTNADGTLKSNFQAAADKLKAQQLGFSGDVNMNSILPGVQESFGNINLNQEGLQAIRDRALSTGESPWLTLQKEAADAETSGQMDKLNRQREDQLNTAASDQMGSAAAARSALAMRGGLSSGARERLAKSGGRDLNSAKQTIRRMIGEGEMNANQQNVANKYGARIADNETQTGLLTQLPGMELAALQPELQKAEYLGNVGLTEQGRQLDTDFKNKERLDNTNKYNIDNNLKEQQYNIDTGLKTQEFNIANMFAEQNAKRAFDQGTYNSQMQGWAANKTGEAIGNSGKK